MVQGFLWNLQGESLSANMSDKISWADPDADFYSKLSRTRLHNVIDFYFVISQDLQ
jgi:hypothetical protein